MGPVEVQCSSILRTSLLNWLYIPLILSITEPFCLCFSHRIAKEIVGGPSIMIIACELQHPFSSKIIYYLGITSKQKYQYRQYLVYDGIHGSSASVGVRIVCSSSSESPQLATSLSYYVDTAVYQYSSSIVHEYYTAVDVTCLYKEPQAV